MPEATPTSDIRFAQFAVKMKFVTPDQVRECILLQRRYMARDAKNFPSLVRIVTAKHYLATHQATAVLEQVRNYEAQLTISDAGAGETNILAPEKAQLVLDMGTAPDEEGASETSATGQPRKISGYRILEKVGIGSMGTVFKARQESMDRIVALKVLPEDMTENRRFVEQFLSEARAAGRLNHPNVIRVHDVGQEDGLYYYSMEYIAGQSLDELIAADGALPPRRVVHLMLQVAQALDHGYRHGIVHREIRPEAIMVAADDQTKLADLGLTKVGSKRFLMGDNAAYVSPEQASGGWTDIRTDLYSLGATFFHALTGEMPFSGPTPRDVLRQHITASVPDPRAVNPDVPPQVAEILMRLLEKNPDDRYQNPAELVEELRELRLVDRPRSSRRNAVSGRRVRSTRRTRRRRRR